MMMMMMSMVILIIIIMHDINNNHNHNHNHNNNKSTIIMYLMRLTRIRECTKWDDAPDDKQVHFVIETAHPKQYKCNENSWKYNENEYE